MDAAYVLVVQSGCRCKAKTTGLLVDVDELLRGCRLCVCVDAGRDRVVESRRVVVHMSLV